MLSISAGLFAGNNTINMPTSLFAALPDYVQTGSIGDGDVTFSATYNDTNITLVIHQGNSGDANHITVSTAG